MQEFAFDKRVDTEGAVSPYEIGGVECESEPEQGSEAESTREHSEATGTACDLGEAGCPVIMGRSGADPRCGRKLHVAPELADEEPVCLMHSKDPNKKYGQLFDLFTSEFERSLAQAESEWGVAHFERFVFPNLDLRNRSFQVHCSFRYAVFSGDAKFSHANFNRSAEFSYATFSHDAKFYRTEFKKNANFSHAVFNRNASFSRLAVEGDSTFSRARFAGHATFSHASFKRSAGFLHAIFSQEVSFSEMVVAGAATFNRARFHGNTIFFRSLFMDSAVFYRATFTGDVNFSRSSFAREANFRESRFTERTNFSKSAFSADAVFAEAKFDQRANFREATFARNTDFADAAFAQDANFRHATFTQNVDFTRTTFTQKANFVETTFDEGVFWTNGRFLGAAEFRRTKFHVRRQGAPSAVFALASFSDPQKIVFDDVDLSRALFHNCDVSAVWFTSSVRWGQRGKGGAMVFEEEIPLDRSETKPLRRNGERDFRALAQIYQQLKKNYDSRLDYWTANEFHFGEMEMKRRAGPTNGRLLWLRQQLHRRMSLVSLYRYVSDYGNSFWKPILWLLGTLVLFTVLYPLPRIGIKRQGATQMETYISVWRPGDPWSQNLWQEVRLATKSGIAAMDTATFQKNAEYLPAYPWGRVLATVEALLTSTLFGLFLLALRRQFRR